MFDPAFLRQAYQAAALVTSLGILSAIGAMLGIYLDGLLGSAPVLSLIFSGIGFAAGLVALFRGMERLQRDDDEIPPDLDR